MQCPYCSSQDTGVVDSRLSEGKDAIRRRRECPACQKRFTTYERREPLRLMVRKRDGSRREPFERAKLHEGLAKACAKRPVSEEEIGSMVDEIEAELRKRRRYEVSSGRLGEMALVRLQGLDMVSYLRFASVFRRYTDAEQFSSEASRLKERSTSTSRGSGLKTVYQKLAESAYEAAIHP